MAHEKVLSGVPRWDDRMWAHKTVMKFFGQYDTSRGSVLFRFEPAKQRFLVQSQELPKIRDNVATKQTDQLVDSVSPGDAVLIKTELNAVRKKSHPGAGQHVHVHVPDAEIPLWIGEVFSRRGIIVDVDRFTFTSNVVKSKNSPLVVAQTEFFATVADCKLFAEAIYSGVGRSKAYGCGLVSFMPSSFM